MFLWKRTRKKDFRKLVFVSAMGDYFKVTPQNSSIQIGQSKLLQCEPPESHPRATVTWYKNGIEVKPDRDSHYRLTNSK